MRKKIVSAKEIGQHPVKSLAPKDYVPNPLKLPTDKMITLSTRHITKLDSHVLAQHGCAHTSPPALPRVESHEYGWFIFVTSDKDEFKEYYFALQNWRFSGALQNIYRLAYKQGIVLIDFDREGEEVEGLETFEW